MVVKMAENEKVVLKIMYDDTADSPREWDNLGTMICFHRRYILGDEHDYSDPRDFLESLAYQFVDHEEVCIEELDNDELMKIIRANAVILPLYLYDHSGITMSTAPFSCPWDSGQVGWIYVTHKDIMKEYGSLDIEKAEKALKAEVEQYDKYLRGEVYGFVLQYKDGHIIDSCWGFYGLDYLEKELKSHLPEKYADLVDHLKTPNLVH